MTQPTARAGIRPRTSLRRGATPKAVDEAGRQLRAPWAASIAGLLFAVLFTAALVLVRSSPLQAADDAELALLFREGRDQWLFIGALYLAPFAGIMFLWFIAVIRDQVGEREDRFFATVFFGSGLVFVALLFAAAAVAGSLVVGVRFSASTRRRRRRPRSCAPCRTPCCSASRRERQRSSSSRSPRSACGAGPSRAGSPGPATSSGSSCCWSSRFWDWIVLLLPAWVGGVSLFILRRDRTLRRAEARAAG